MKRLTGLLIICFFVISIASETFAQGRRIPASLRAQVTQRLGTDTDITLDFGRPGVKGRKIWGGLVPYGLYPGDNYSDGKPYPWRAGANQNTTIELAAQYYHKPLRFSRKSYRIGRLIQ